MGVSQKARRESPLPKREMKRLLTADHRHNVQVTF